MPDPSPPASRPSPVMRRLIHDLAVAPLDRAAGLLPDPGGPPGGSAERTCAALMVLAQELRAAGEPLRGLIRTLRAEGDDELALELHDVAGSAFTAGAFNAEAAATLLAAGDEDGGSARLAALHAVVSEARIQLALLRDTTGPEQLPRTTPEHEALRLGPGVRLRVVGTTRHAEPLEHAAGRIVQESVTNARRHAPGSLIQIDVVRRPGGLFLRIRNRLPAGGLRVAGTPGLGLRGMCRRARALGGRLAAGPAGDGTWLVTAHVPARRRGDGAHPA